jgi:hypothetical protein
MVAGSLKAGAYVAPVTSGATTNPRSCGLPRALDSYCGEYNLPLAESQAGVV